MSAVKAKPTIVVDDIRQHCEMIHRLALPLKGQGKVLVAGFGEDPDKPHPKTGKPGRPLAPVVQTFDIGQVETMVAFIAALAAKPHRNVYVPLAVLRSDLEETKKGSESDVVGVLGLVPDFDDADAVNWRVRLPVSAPYVLETSKGRFQPFLLFDRPYPPAAVKPFAIQLKNSCGCDHGTVDLSHVWRVPGTLNWPNAKKLAEGRAPEPQLVTVLQPHTGDPGYSLDELAAEFPETEAAAEESSGDVSIDLLVRMLPPRLYKQIVAPKPGDRSKALFAVIKQLGARDLDAALIERIIRTYPAGIGAKYADRQDLAQEIARVLSKPDPPRSSWQDDLIMGEGDKPKSNLANAITALRSAPEWQGVLAFDQFAQKIVISGQAPWFDAPPDQPVDWTSTDDIRVADWLQHNGIFVATRTAGEAVYMVAQDRQYHPVRNYLQSLYWDGCPRLDTWCVTYLGAVDQPYVRAVGARFLISAVARIMKPGCKADCALVLEGEQGTLKSTAIMILSQPWFTDEIAELGTKDSAMQLAGAWFVEWAELDSMTRADIDKVKAYMSRSTDRFRPPYGHHVIELKRQCVFVGTSNKEQYLRDETGGRRFWPINCGKIDITALRRDRDQLWTEALHRFNAGEHWWLDTIELNTDAAEQQAARRVQDPWEPIIEKFLRSRSDITSQEILTDAVKIPIDRQDQTAANRVARCLKAIGWSRYQVGSGPDRGKWHYRPNPAKGAAST